MANGYYYTVNGNQEEFDCHQCGAPVYNGERAWMVKCNKREAEFPVCSKTCDKHDLEAWEMSNREWYEPEVMG